jgi:Flp pilus assembly protein TadD
MRSKRTKVLAAVSAGILLIVGLWYFSSSRVLKVWVYTDYAFRVSHPNWPGLLEARFQEVNRIYQRNRTGVIWKVLDSSEMDPTNTLPGLDNRRTNMALHQDRPTDIFVIFTGIHEGDRTGSVSPFTRTAVVVDYANKSESVNSRLLAHELAHLFGVPHDPAWLETLMGDKPESARFSDRSIAVIKRMRNYPFQEGIDGLSHGSWEKRALESASQDDIATHGNAMAHAHTVLAIALMNERKTARALEHFRAAVKADPQDKILHLNLAEAYTRDAQYDKALAEAREAVRVAPNDAVAHRALGALLGHNKQPEAALQELQTAIRLEPDNSQNKILLGLEYASIFGRLDDAVATLHEATLADPNSDMARKNLEKAETLKERVDAELIVGRQWVHDHPDDADGHDKLGKIEARAGDLKGAIRDFQRVADLRPDNGNPHMELADIYLAQGDTDSAWAEVRKARALGIEPPQALMARLPAQK